METQATQGRKEKTEKYLQLPYLTSRAWNVPRVLLVPWETWVPKAHPVPKVLLVPPERMENQVKLE
jgi:hypothetical protein